MSIHVQTGNALDVVYGYDDQDKKVLHGLCRHNSTEIIPLPDPAGLIAVLRQVLREIEEPLESEVGK